jgi:hypothetical protein
MLAMTTAHHPTTDTRPDGRLKNASSATNPRSVGFPYAIPCSSLLNKIRSTTSWCVYQLCRPELLSLDCSPSKFW